MPDYLFYPFAAIVAAAMVYAAVAPGAAERAAVMAEMGNPQQGLTISGDRLQSLVVPEGLTMEIVELDDGQPVARMAAFGTPEQYPSAGVFYPLPPAFQAYFAERDVRVTVTARQTETGGSSSLLLGYFGQGGRDRARRREFPVGETFGEISTVLPAPAADGSGLQDYIGIWPDPGGLGRTIEVLSIEAELVDTPPALRP